MSLSKDDLQAFREIVREEIINELDPINEKLNSLDKRLKKVEKTVTVVKEDLHYVIGDFDNQLATHRRKIEKLERNQLRSSLT